MSSNENAYSERFHQFQQRIQHHKQKLSRKLQKQNEELEETRKHLWYKQIADSLLASPGTYPRGSSQVSIVNAHTLKEEQVSLNPKLDAKENAELFYKKARRAKRGEEISRKKVEATRQELQTLHDIECRISDAQNEQITDEVYLSLENSLQQCGALTPEPNKSGKHRQERIPYRHFHTDGWDIFIGKTDTQNDELTIRFAVPSDIWLHVAGHPGSHVVIRRSKNQQMPSREVIVKAAALAVYFSKAKHTSFADVHYTEARYVHKRRHAPAGEVILDRYKTIRVAPKSPQDLFRVPFLDGEQE